MGGATKSLSLIRRAAWPALALIIIGTFGGHAIAGPNGLFAWKGYRENLEIRRTELAELKAEKAKLKHKSVLLDPRAADPDLGEEMIRKDLGLVRADEVIIPLE
jgi:cell division protein FtsB